MNLEQFKIHLVYSVEIKEKVISLMRVTDKDNLIGHSLDEFFYLLRMIW